MNTALPASLQDMLASLYAAEIAPKNARRLYRDAGNWARLEREGYLAHNGTEYVLTETGRAVGAARYQETERARARRNANARGRSEALRDLGLTRTPYGWE